MATEDKLVAVVSPWEKLSELVKEKFRVESLPAEKKVMVWRDDLQTPDALAAALKELGVTPSEIGARPVTNWKERQ